MHKEIEEPVIDAVADEEDHESSGFDHFPEQEFGPGQELELGMALSDAVLLLDLKIVKAAAAMEGVEVALTNMESTAMQRVSSETIDGGKPKYTNDTTRKAAAAELLSKADDYTAAKKDLADMNFEVNSVRAYREHALRVIGLLKALGPGKMLAHSMNGVQNIVGAMERSDDTLDDDLSGS